MRLLLAINFYLTKTLYNELVKEYKWARRLDNFNRKPVYVELSLDLLYCSEYTSDSFKKYIVKIDKKIPEDEQVFKTESLIPKNLEKDFSVISIKEKTTKSGLEYRFINFKRKNE